MAEIYGELEFGARERNRAIENGAGKIDQAWKDEAFEVDLILEMLIREIGIRNLQPKPRFIRVSLAVPVQGECACFLEIGLRLQKFPKPSRSRRPSHLTERPRFVPVHAA